MDLHATKRTGLEVRDWMDVLAVPWTVISSLATMKLVVWMRVKLKRAEFQEK
jgi:hypothetical protein